MASARHSQGHKRSHSLVCGIVVWPIGTGPAKYLEQSGEWFRTFLGWPLSGCLKNLRAQRFSSGTREHSLPPKGPSWQTPPRLRRASRATPNSVPKHFPGSSGRFLCLHLCSAVPAEAERSATMSPRARGRAPFPALWSRGLRATTQQVPLVDRKHPHSDRRPSLS